MFQNLLTLLTFFYFIILLSFTKNKTLFIDYAVNNNFNVINFNN